MPIKKLLARGAILATGLSIKKLLEFGFDMVLYPAALALLGYVTGGAVMMAAAIILNALIIKAYDWSKTDWLYIEEIKKVRDSDDVKLPGILNILKPLLRKGDIFAFFILCFDDPVTVVLYLRKGSHLYNGMSSRDWKIFFAANVVANLYWITGLIAIIETFKFFL